MAAGDRLLVASLLPECDASRADSRSSVIYAAPPPPPPLPGLPARTPRHPSSSLGLHGCPSGFLSRCPDLPSRTISLDSSTPGHPDSSLKFPNNRSECLQDGCLGDSVDFPGLPVSGDSLRDCGSKRVQSSQYQLATDQGHQHHQCYHHHHHHRHLQRVPHRLLFTDCVTRDYE